MTEAGQNQLDQRIRALCDARDLQGAATEILRNLGPDVVRVLQARFRDEEATAEVFARFAESLWRSLPAFEFRSSVRAWVFTLARNAGSRYLAREVRRGRAGVPLSRVPELEGQVNHLRTATLAHLRTSNRDRVEALRRELTEPDQLLLMLRVDRKLDYREIAQVTLEDTEAAPEALDREAARLRKRFQLIKGKLRAALAREPPTSR